MPLFTGVVTAGPGQPPRRPGQAPGADQGGVPADWLRQVRRSIQLEEYGAAEAGEAGGEFRAGNPAHRFDSRFDARGVRLKPTDGSAWEWGLSLARWGRADAPAPAGAGRGSAREDRVELDRGPLTEWFVNTPEGLEHGFTLPAPPGGAADELAFDLALEGNLRPVFAEDGQAVDFYGSGNVSVLRYAKLQVADATGTALAARMEPIAGGIRIAVQAGGAIYPITVDPLATTPAWTAVGGAASDAFGISVATAGDVNGDGYSDVIVGSHGYSGYTGKAYLYLGGASGLRAGASWTATGEATSNFFGASVSTAGDVNGDGYSDLIVGAYYYGTNVGKVYLYLGGPGGPGASASWTAVGEGAVRFGYSVATAGDVNGDGYSDVIIGATYAANFQGKAYLYLGGPGGLGASASWTAVGEAYGDAFGTCVATAGDVNADGYSDLMISAEIYPGYAGKAYLYLGGSGGPGASASWTAVGEADNDRFGAGPGVSVATAGDVNGDGYSDVIVAAAYNSSYVGKAYLYLGGLSGLSASPSWTAVGEAADVFGWSVATAGDANGDGYSDVIVGAYGYSGSTGKAYLYLGGASGLSPSASWTAVGEAASDAFGYSVSTAGDVNGDGYSDLIVGATYVANFQGKAYLYLGGPSGPTTGSSWIAAGEATGSQLGYSVSTAGDVNGDGYSDLIVGAYGYSTNRGKAYLHLGGAGGPSVGASWTAIGEAGNDQFGYSLAAAGDVNGDGYSDVIVGARGYSGSTGRAYLYLGGSSGLRAGASWTATGEATSNLFGASVSTAGDVNGDGYSDLVVGAPGNAASRGKAYLYLGALGGPGVSVSWTAIGEAAADSFGSSVSTAGDANGDGYSDLIVGAPGNAASRGKAYLYLGGPAGPGASASWAAAGEATSNFFGASVSTAGDVNGDGYSDGIVGARGNSGSTGKAYLYLGGFSGLGASAAWTAAGEAATDSFGCSVSRAGDVNGDGYSDVGVGACGSAGSTGKAYLYLGGRSGLGASASWTAAGEAGASLFGNSVSTAGDVNGDGYSDLLVGANGYSGSTGKAYLYFGGGGAVVPLRPRQLRADLSAPIHPGGTAYQQQFRLGLTLRSPVGRVRRALQWQIAPWGATLSPTFNPVVTDSSWFINAVNRTQIITLPEDLQSYVWRARVKYHPAQSPFVPHSPWVTLSANGLYETDLFSTSQVAPGPCAVPDEQTYISLVTLDANGKPVLHYQDPNQPAAVTGYNIYRSSSPTGPWTMIGSNVVDMDAGTANKQYVDQTGNLGGPWYYKITAYNGACGAEGPF